MSKTTQSQLPISNILSWHQENMTKPKWLSISYALCHLRIKTYLFTKNSLFHKQLLSQTWDLSWWPTLENYHL